MRTSRAAGYLAAGVLVAALAGCSDQLGDRGGDEGAAPDKIADVDTVVVFRNADNFPNIARVCIEGVAFATTSSGSRGESGVAAPALVRMARVGRQVPRREACFERLSMRRGISARCDDLGDTQDR